MSDQIRPTKAYCFTERGLNLIFDSPKDAKAAYEDAKSKGFNVAQEIDRVIMLDLKENPDRG
ncbi:MAG: hypothetical protein AAGD09_03440 [Cyanobacteria bacterium P01_F01_bin.56]